MPQSHLVARFMHCPDDKPDSDWNLHLAVMYGFPTCWSQTERAKAVSWWTWTSWHDFSCRIQWKWGFRKSLSHHFGLDLLHNSSSFCDSGPLRLLLLFTSARRSFCRGDCSGALRLCKLQARRRTATRLDGAKRAADVGRGTAVLQAISIVVYSCALKKTTKSYIFVWQKTIWIGTVNFSAIPL